MRSPRFVVVAPLLLAVAACPRLTLTKEENIAPVIVIEEADASQTAEARATVVLRASASDEDDGAEGLRFQWSQLATDPIQVPIADAKTSTASVVAPSVATTLNFLVTASDGIDDSAPGLVTVTVVVPEDQRPVATGVAEQLRVVVGDNVVLDGTPSTDPEGDTLAFTWTQLLDEGGVPVNLRDADTAVASFTAPVSDGPLFFQLLVDDGVNESLPFIVRVDIDPIVNLPPTVVLADDFIEAEAGSTVVLDAVSSTDPEGAVLSFRWEQVIVDGATPVNVLTPLASSASFTAPDQTTRLFFRVFVGDGVNIEQTGVVQVDVFVPPNIQPVARVADATRAVITGSTVVLDGGASSDADTDPLTFRWTQTAGAVALPGLPASTSSFTFTAPAEATRLVFELTVNDGLIDSVPAVVIVDVTPPPNTAPVARMADAGGLLIDVLQVQGDAQVALDGSASSDADGDALAPRWVRLDNGVPVNLSPASGESTVVTFRAPDLTTTMFFALTVNDGVVDSVPHVVRVEITQRENQPPVIDLARADQVASAEAAVVLDARGTSDPEDRPLTFRWTQVDNGNDPPVNITAATSSIASFVAPDQDATLTFRLTVSDGVNTSIGIFTVTVVQDQLNALPVVVPLADLVVVQTGQTVQLRCGQGVNTPDDGEDEDDDCRDPDGSITAFKWALASGPPGGSAVFSPPQGDIRAPTVRLTGRGTYFLSLTATDNLNDTSPPELVRIDVINSPPRATPPDDDTTVNGSAITLVGSGIDADGDVLSFRWSMIDNPDGGRVGLLGANTPAVSFTPSKKTPVSDPADCVDGGGCYQLQLVVSDGREDSAPVTVFVTSTDRSPVARAGSDNDGLLGDIFLDGSLSFDPDGDTITTFAWRQTAGTGLAPDGTAGLFTGETVRIVAPVQDQYEFELVVTAAGVQSPPDRVLVSIDNVNSVPVLSAAETRFVVGDGEPAAFSVTVTDLDDTVHAVVWNRVDGNPAFPQTMSGKTPDLIGPDYLAALAAPEGSSATYAVTATDPAGAVSNTLRLEIFAGPGLRDFVVVDSGPDASTAATCGSVATPCATLAAAFAVVDPDANGIGDGRDVVLTTQTFQVRTVRPPGGTSLLGGRDPTTFIVAGDTEIIDDDGASPGAVPFVAYTASSQDVVIEHMTFRWTRDQGEGFPFRSVFQCVGATLTLRDSTLIHVGSFNNAAFESGLGCTATVERVRIEVSGATDDLDPFLLLGGDVTIRDADAFVTIRNPGQNNSGVRLTAGKAVVERSRFIISGASSGIATNGFRVTGGNMVARNNFVFMAAPGDGSGLSQSGGSGSYFHNTFVAPGGMAANTGAVELSAAVGLMNNIFDGYSRGVRLLAVAAEGSKIYGNAFNSPGASEIDCDSAANQLNTEAEINAAAASVCNGTTDAWTGNIVAACPFIDVANGDLHLNNGITNRCIDAALASSPAGVAVADDFDNVTRTGTFDIGADER
jgi:hypothetical protein